MLILTRFIGQDFHIYLENGETISIKLVDTQLTPYGCISKIGITAPRKYNIVRTELLRKNGIPVPGDPGFPSVVEQSSNVSE